MTTFNVTIDDQAYLDGITAAREAYNKAVGVAITNEQGEEMFTNVFETDEEYVEFVLTKAAESYAKQYGI
jgi:hypothetical protein